MRPPACPGSLRAKATVASNPPEAIASRTRAFSPPLPCALADVLGDGKVRRSWPPIGPASRAAIRLSSLVVTGNIVLLPGDGDGTFHSPPSGEPDRGQPAGSGFGDQRRFQRRRPDRPGIYFHPDRRRGRGRPGSLDKGDPQAGATALLAAFPLLVRPRSC